MPVVCSQCHPPPEAHAEVSVESFLIESFDPQQNLFSFTGPSNHPGPFAAGGEVENWVVSVNLERLRSLPESIVLNLPGQAPETLPRIRSATRTNNGFLWTGGREGCAALLSSMNGRFRASISCLYGHYRVETTQQGTHLSRFAYGPAPAAAQYDTAEVTSTFGIAEQCQPAPPESPDSQIDVMILYTPQVTQGLQAEGINVQQFMQDTLDETQLAMDRSTSPGEPVIASLNLVHAQEIDRPENESFQQDLLYLSDPGVPASLRIAHAADLIMLIRETTPNPNQCGLANTAGLGMGPPPGPGFSPFAVGVTRRRCCAPDQPTPCYSTFPFQHEFGHLFGGNHNPENAPPPSVPKIRPWAFAHWKNHTDGESSARTIVAYQLSDCQGSCPQVLNYSNADVTLTKPWPFRTGLTNTRENARVIEEFAPVTAQYCKSLSSDVIFANGFEQGP